MELLLIQTISQYESLYNVKSTHYRDQGTRNEAWEEISKKLNLPASECREVWAKLRNCYTNAMKRRQKKNSHAAKNKAPWKYENEMSFLLPEARGTTDYYSSVQTENSDVIDYENVDIIESENCDFIESENSEAIESENGDVVYDESIKDEFMSVKDESLNCTAAPSDAKKRPNKKNSDKYFEKMFKLMKNSSDLRQKKLDNARAMDDVDLFFLSMSKSLKKLPKIDQTKIKIDLHMAIYEAEKRQIHRHNSPH